MNNDKTLFFAGIDWGSTSHQLCLTDHNGCFVGERAFAHAGAGLCDIAQWLLELSGSSPENIAVGIEVTRGPVVETLLDRGFGVHSINPRQLDRFRDRFSPSGAKDDRRDQGYLLRRSEPTAVTSECSHPRTPTSRCCASLPAPERK